jgi:hypothetical protein
VIVDKESREMRNFHGDGLKVNRNSRGLSDKYNKLHQFNPSPAEKNSKILVFKFILHISAILCFIARKIVNEHQTDWFY